MLSAGVEVEARKLIESIAAGVKHRLLNRVSCVCIISAQAMLLIRKGDHRFVANVALSGLGTVAGITLQAFRYKMPTIFATATGSIWYVEEITIFFCANTEYPSVTTFMSK